MRRFKDYTEKERDELESYIRSELDYDIYERLTSGYFDDPGAPELIFFDPLKFFRLFNNEKDFILANKTKPLFVSQRIGELGLNCPRLDFLIDKITLYFEKTDDNEIKICLKALKRVDLTEAEYLNEEQTYGLQAEPNIFYDEAYMQLGGRPIENCWLINQMAYEIESDESTFRDEFRELHAGAVKVINERKGDHTWDVSSFIHTFTLTNNENLNDFQLFFLIGKTIEWFRQKNYRNDAQIRSVITKLQNIADNITGISTQDAFESLLEYLETLPNIKSKMACLIEEKTKWQHANPNDLGGRSEHSFTDKCELEITKYREIATLENTYTGRSTNVAATPVPDANAIHDEDLDVKRKADGKLDFRQIMVLLSEFIPEFANADNKKKGAFIAAITPYVGVKRIGDEFSYINSFAKDHAEMVRHWKRELKSTKRGRPRLNNYRKN